MAKTNRTRKSAVLDVDGICCIDYDDEQERSHTSPKSPNNLKYARSHAELSGRKDPALTKGVAFTEELETEDYWCWE